MQSTPNESKFQATHPYVWPMSWPLSPHFCFMIFLVAIELWKIPHTCPTTIPPLTDDQFAITSFDLRWLLQIWFCPYLLTPSSGYCGLLTFKMLPKSLFYNPHAPMRHWQEEQLLMVRDYKHSNFQIWRKKMFEPAQSLTLTFGRVGIEDIYRTKPPSHMVIFISNKSEH